MAINAGGVIRGAKSLSMGLKSTFKGNSAASSIMNKVSSSKVATTALKSAAISTVAIPLVSSALKSVSSNPTYQRIDEKLGGYLPGGITVSQDNVLDLHGGIARNWNTGTTTMGILRDGNWYAVKKNGTVKIFRPTKNIVFGKKVEPRKFIRVALKYRGIHKELNSVFKSIKLRRK